jgi:cytochrome P450
MIEQTSATDFSDFDTVANAAEPDPFSVLNAMRERCPVARSEQHGGFWILSRYEDVRSVARDPDGFSSAQGVTIPASGHMPVIPIEADPPLHECIREPIEERFSPHEIAKHQGEVREVASGLIDDFIEQGEGDLAFELTIPLPAIMITRLLGLPEPDAALFLDWAKRMMSLVSVSHDTDLMVEIAGYFHALWEDRRGAPRDDIPSIVAATTVGDREITEMEFISTMAALFSAGQDTTANFSANALEYLALHPELRARLLDDPELLPRAVEELLRFISPVLGLGRLVTREATVAGQAMQAGDRVLLSWGAANHDPRRFPDPDTLKFERPAAGHVAFGYGIHRCLGQHVARLEMRVILEEVLRRLPDYELRADAPVKRAGGVTRMIHSLPVRFTPGPRTGREDAAPAAEGAR